MAPPTPGSRQQQAYDELFRRPQPAPTHRPSQPPSTARPGGGGAHAQQQYASTSQYGYSHPQQKQLPQYAAGAAAPQVQQGAYAQFGLSPQQPPLPPGHSAHAGHSTAYGHQSGGGAGHAQQLAPTRAGQYLTQAGAVPHRGHTIANPGGGQYATLPHDRSQYAAGTAQGPPGPAHASLSYSRSTGATPAAYAAYAQQQQPAAPPPPHAPGGTYSSAQAYQQQQYQPSMPGSPAPSYHSYQSSSQPHHASSSGNWSSGQYPAGYSSAGDYEYGSKSPDPSRRPNSGSSTAGAARPGYAPSLSSGPPSASTSASLFSRTSTSSMSSLLPYATPAHAGGDYTSTPSSSSGVSSLDVSPNPPTIPLPTPSAAPRPPSGASSIYSAGSSSTGGSGGGYAQPPRLPEINPTTGDDFFGDYYQPLPAGDGVTPTAANGEGGSSYWTAKRISSGGASITSMGARSVTPTIASAKQASKRYSPALRAEDVEGYTPTGAYDYASPPTSFDRSRRSSADSDVRSLYQPAPAGSGNVLGYEPRSPAMSSLNRSSSSLAYPYGSGTPFAASTPALHPRTSSESFRGLPTPGGKGPPPSSYADSRALSFTSIERPDPHGLGLAIGRSPYGAGGNGNGNGYDPSLSSSTNNFSMSHPSLPMSVRPPSYGSGHAPSSSALIPVARKTPVVYPALLSRVAAAFRDHIALSERVKDGLVYQDAFDGRDAVDKIAYIIKTSDRNLALLLGRALDAQKFFHDVTYDHRLRDSPNEIYQFKERLASAGANFTLPADQLLPPHQQHLIAQHPHAPSSAAALAQAAGEASGKRTSSSTTPSPAAGGAGSSEDEYELPTGVFTLLTDCYSPTCTRERLCYSIACPRRLEQQARLNLKREGLSGGLEDVKGLKRSDSIDSLILREPGSLWIHSVPQEVADSTSDTEKKRQEAINEVFYTERDFVRDLEYLRDFWIKPLRTQNIIPESRREDFVTQVFWNVLEVYAVNVRLCELLNKRQKQAHVVDHIGDIFLDLVPHFGPYVKYGAHQLYGKYEFEKEKGSNPAFAKFVDETERLPESRKLELNGYLTKPTTRLARYPLLLDACLKHTSDDNPDKIALPKVIKLVREFLGRVNVETGKSENRFNLAQLDQQLVFKNGEAVDLRLRDEERELIFKGPLKKRGGTQSESAELQVFLFDHAILMVKQKSKNEQYKVYRKPIPLELLVVASIDDAASARGGVVRPKSLMARGSSKSSTTTSSNQPPPGADKNKQGFALTFIHLGRRGYQLTLWASTWTARKKWLDKIEERQHELRERSLVFETLPLSAGYFVGTNRLTCAAPFDNGNRVVYGTDNGVYLADLREKNKVPVKVISAPSVTQLDVLEEQGILIVLADKAVQTFFIDHLDPGDAIGAAKRARKISANATFFKAGQCLGRTLVCVVKSGNVSSTIKTLEPVDQARGKKQPTIRKFLQGSNESLRVFKEFYIPTESSSVHFLKSKLCVGCTKGFEIVDLETLDTQGLLDPADSSLDFVQKRESAKPIAIYRIDGEFLLCYDEFAFYVNKNGWRAKGNWIIQWEGFPTAFALHYPYVLAFEPTFIEVRHVESGALMQIIPGNNIRCLFADSRYSAAAPAAASYYHQQQRYGSPYGQRMPPPPPPPTRGGIVVSDGDRAFSLIFNAPLDM
ncbi:hypothetical protein JCM10908_003959 [Rhodotorula pacifica]|uniref:uncharacterized protein n=1 Tax=Rhodotorula pacifica TaxID=1495444 RepID=UPI00316CFDDE